MSTKLPALLVAGSITLGGCQALQPDRTTQTSPPQPPNGLVFKSPAPATADAADQTRTESALNKSRELIASAASKLSIFSRDDSPASRDLTYADGRIASAETAAPAEPNTAEATSVSGSEPSQSATPVPADQPTDPERASLQQSLGQQSLRQQSLRQQSLRQQSLQQQLNWLPELADPEAVLDLNLERARSIDDKIAALMSLAYLIDAELYIRFRDLIDHLSGADREQVIAEQRAFLDQRQVLLTQAYLEFKAEKAARYNAARAFIRATKQRAEQIRELRSGLSG